MARCGAKPRILGVFGVMWCDAAVSGSRQRSRQRCEAGKRYASKTRYGPISLQDAVSQKTPQGAQ